MHYAIRCPKCGSKEIKNWEHEATDTLYAYEQEEKRIIPEFSCLNCSEIFGCVAEDSNSLPQSHCVAFHFSVGDNQEVVKSIHFEREDSYTTIEVVSHHQKVKKKARVLLTEWQTIKEDLFNQIFILSWQTEHKERHEAEGKQWEVCLRFDDRQSYVVTGYDSHPVLYFLLLDLINPYLIELGFEKECITDKK